jgi:hypothetical protein
MLTSECVWLRQTTHAQAADKHAEQAPPSAATKSNRSTKSGSSPEAIHPRRAPLSAEERAAARQLELLQLMELLKDYDMFAPEPPSAKSP